MNEHGRSGPTPICHMAVRERCLPPSHLTPIPHHPWQQESDPLGHKHGGDCPAIQWLQHLEEQAQHTLPGQYCRVDPISRDESEIVGPAPSSAARARELTLPFTNCSGPFTLPGQHSRADPVTGDTGELAASMRDLASPPQLPHDGVSEGEMPATAPHGLWWVGELVPRTRELASWPCFSPAAALRSMTVRLDNMVGLALVAQVEVSWP